MGPHTVGQTKIFKKFKSGISQSIIDGFVSGLDISKWRERGFQIPLKSSRNWNNDIEIEVKAVLT